MVAIHFFGMDSQPVSLYTTNNKPVFSVGTFPSVFVLILLIIPQVSSFSMTPSQADQLGELGQVDIFMAVCGKSFIVDLDVAKTPGSQMLSVEWPQELFYYALLKRGPSNGNGKVSKAGWGSFDCVEIERNNNFLPTLASGVEIIIY